MWIIHDNSCSMLLFTPYHLIDNANIRLHNLHYLCRYILINIIWYRNTMLTIAAKLNGSIYSLEQRLLIDTSNDKVALVDSLMTLSRCTDADSRERMAYRGEEATLLRKVYQNQILLQKHSSEDSCSRGSQEAHAGLHVGRAGSLMLQDGCVSEDDSYRG